MTTKMEEKQMADYKYDGKELRCKGSKIGIVDGKWIRDSHGAKVGEVEGMKIRDSHGAKVAEFDGKTIRDGHGGKVETIDKVQKQIDGTGGISLVALWWFFIR
jgi:hypothetical protein